MSKVQSMEKARERKQAGEGITVTLGQLLDSQSGLNAITQTRLPGKSSLMFGRLMRDINKEFETYNPVKKELCERYGKLSEDQTIYQFEGEDAQKFNVEHQETLKAEITLNHKTMPEILGLIQLTPAEALNLEWLLVGRAPND